MVWFHASSLGEFEQGRPIIEAFRKRWPQTRIALSFFSPSGYEVRKSYDQADVVFYLPLDTPGNAHRLLDILKPQKVIFVKYDFWFNLLAELDRRRIPAYYISCLFRPGQYLFRWYGGWALNRLRTIRQLLQRQGQEQKQFEFLEEHPIIRPLSDYSLASLLQFRRERKHDERQVS